MRSPIANWARWPHEQTNASIGKTSSSGTTTTVGPETKRADLLGLTYRGSPSGHRSSLTSHNVGPSLDRIERTDMDIESVVAQLRQEASRIEHAIGALMALVGLGSQPARRGRPPKTSRAKPASGQKRRRMSASARARISAAMKQRWAKQKGAASPKKAAPAAKKAAPAQKKASARKPMSPAMRKKLSAMMKARWAARKKAA